MSAEQRPTRSSRHKRRRPMVRRSLLSAATFTALLGTCSIGVVGFTYAKYNGQIKRQNVLQTGDRNIVSPKAQLHAANYLIIGSDSRAGAGAGYGHVDGARSDTTILVHISQNHRDVSVVSIPRDSWVDIPRCTDPSGHAVAAHQEMFNSAFSIGGARCTIATVQKLTGIAVRHFVQIDFAGFRSMVDALGTVPICSQKVVDDPKSKLVLHKGINHLGGKQALAFVRTRESLGDGSDLGRIKRQQLFMGIVLRQAMSGTLLSNPVRLTDFLDAATNAITVDSETSLGDLRTLASAMHGLDPKHVTFYTSPIANRDYSPPGSGLTGKVKLDATAGRVLYAQIINDHASATSKPGTAASAAATTKVPKPDTNAARTSCTL